MYQPNFCSECGTKLLRLRWHLWTSRRFCSKCARRLRKERFLPPLAAVFAIGRLGLHRRTDPASAAAAAYYRAANRLTSQRPGIAAFLKSTTHVRIRRR
jgi:hypothetical protein